MFKRIRCNDCFTRADLDQTPFNLTECGHIFCNRCVDQAKKQCAVCNTTGAPTICLQEPLDDSVAIFFKPIKETLTLVLRVISFQEEQLELFIKKFDAMDQKYRYAKEAYRNMEMGIVKIHNKYKEEKSEDEKKIRKLEHEIMEMQHALEKRQRGPFHYYDSKPTVPTSTRDRPTFTEKQSSSKLKFNFATLHSSQATSRCFIASSNLGRINHSSYVESGSVFRVPNMGRGSRSTKNPLSGRTKMSASTCKLPSRFDSMKM